MPFFRSSIKPLIISLILGILIALAFRSSWIVATTDLHYFRVGNFNYPLLESWDETQHGKKVIGLGGFPFSAFSDCKMNYHEELISPACNKESLLGNWSIIVNTIVWGILILGILYLKEVKGRLKNKIKPKSQ